jgi:hypothetical protein
VVSYNTNTSKNSFFLSCKTQTDGNKRQLLCRQQKEVHAAAAFPPLTSTRHLQKSMPRAGTNWMADEKKTSGTLCTWWAGQMAAAAFQR